MLTADVISADRDAQTTSGFNVRVSTVMPTGSRWWTLMVGTSFTPFGTSGVSERNLNTPTFFFGNIFPILDARHSGGWLTVSLPVLGHYTFRGGSTRNRRLYGNDLYVEAAFTAHVGEKLLSDLGPFWKQLDLYVYIDQNLSPNKDLTTFEIDRFNPLFLYGLKFPLAGSAR